MPTTGWEGLVRRQEPAERLVVRTPIRQSQQGGSGTFLAECSDGKLWWVKPQNNPQVPGNPKIVGNEFLIGSVGKVIDAPVCDVAVARIPADIVGWEYRPGYFLEEGLTSASAAVPDVVEERSLTHNHRDDNAVRHAGIHALYDLCWGDDAQWLYREPEDKKVFSHDHGLYLPGGGSWTVDSLTNNVDVPHEFPTHTGPVSAQALRDMADAVESIARAQLLEIFALAPIEWPISDEELETLGWFIERRRQGVGERLRARAGQN